MVLFFFPHPTTKQDVKTEKRSTTKAYGGSVSFLFSMGVVAESTQDQQRVKEQQEHLWSLTTVLQQKYQCDKTLISKNVNAALLYHYHLLLTRIQMVCFSINDPYYNSSGLHSDLYPISR